VTIRRATGDDLAAIMTLERTSFPTDAWSEAMMREELASPHGWYIVDDEAGRLVGYAGLRAVSGARDADIQTIAIAEVSRGRGRGRSLLQALLNEALRRGVSDVFLEVRADNPVAQALYVSEGFAEIGRKPRYYQPDDVDAVVMKLDLRGWHHAATGSATGAAGSAAGSRIRNSENRTLSGVDAAEPPEHGAKSEFRSGGNLAWDGGVCT
jgi:ribosomal-protein-alanine N-acetyltransferase